MVAAIALATVALAAPGTFDRITTDPQPLTYVTTAPNDPSTLYLVEQQGIVRTWPDDKVFVDLRATVSQDGGERGLLSLAFSPHYAQNGLYYVYFTDRSGDVRVLEEPTGRSLLDIPHPNPNHNGGQLQFDRSGLLYAGTGDGGLDPAKGDAQPGDPNNNSQNLKSQFGKLLRIDPANPSATWKLVALGLRNPWRFSFDRATGDLWIGDVGAATYEEVDHRPRARIGAVADYGWSHYEGPIVYKKGIKLALPKAYVPPVYAYTHGNGGAQCAIVGGYVHRGRYYFGDLCSGSVWTFPAAAKHPQPVRLAQRIPALSSFGEASDGTLYAVDQNGGVWKLSDGG